MSTQQSGIQQSNIRWIDNMRALVMLMVIYGHIVAKPASFFLLTSPMKMPGFFAISGYLFHCTDRSFGQLAVNKLKKLAVPYFFLCAVEILWNLLILWPTAGMTGFLEMLKSVVLGTMLWYLPCLFICEFAFYMLVRLCRNKLCWICVGAVCLLVAGLLIIQERVVLPWHISSVPVVMFFFFLGYGYRQMEQRLPQWNGWLVLVVLTVVYAAMCAAQYYMGGQTIDVNQNVYPNVWLSIPMIVAGVAWLCQLMKQIPMPRFVTFIGRNTLLYYGVHYQMAQTLTIFLRRCGVAEQTFFLWYYPLVQMVATLVITAGLALLVNRFCPFLVGKRKIQTAQTKAVG